MHNSLKRKALQFDEGNHLLNDMNGHKTMELLVLCGAHRGGLMCSFLATGLPAQSTSSTSFSSSSLACPLEIVQTPAASSACRMQL